MKANSLTYGESSLVDYINGEFSMERVLFLIVFIRNSDEADREADHLP